MLKSLESTVNIVVDNGSTDSRFERIQGVLRDAHAHCI